MSTDSSAIGGAMLLFGAVAALGAVYVVTRRDETERRLTVLERVSASHDTDLREVLTDLRALTADLRAGHTEPAADAAPASVRQLRVAGVRR